MVRGLNGALQDMFMTLLGSPHCSARGVHEGMTGFVCVIIKSKIGQRTAMGLKD